MDYIIKEYKGMFIPYIVGAFIFAFAPWCTGPYWLNLIAIFISSYFFFTWWIIARTIFLSFRNRRNKRK